MAKHKKIDITLLNKEALKKITFEDLISDAAARKDKKTNYDFSRHDAEGQRGRGGADPRPLGRCPRPSSWW